MPRTNEYIFYQGKRFQVEFFFDETGALPAKEYLEDLSEQKVLVKLAAFVKLIADEGILYDEQKFRIVDRAEKIYEFKPLGHRLFNFFYAGGKIIITNGYAKKAQKLDRRELARAIRLKNDYIERVMRGEYYEKE
jgi:Fe-S-cluster containining protein